MKLGTYLTTKGNCIANMKGMKGDLIELLYETNHVHYRLRLRMHNLLWRPVQRPVDIKSLIALAMRE